MFATLFQTLSHLPVTTIAESVADHFCAQMIPVVTSEVASGKTMLIPAYCAMLLQDDPVDKVVYVLEPTRFLANNAAESLRQLLGPDQENLIGCINSNRSDDESVLHPNNRIIFTTVGYALSSGILKTRNNFILDEAHETSIDLSLTKAYLYHRLERGDQINIAVLSATIDITNEMEYWGDEAVHFTTKGSAHPVTYLHRPAFTLAESTLTLIQDHGRQGILVFVSGAEEITDAVEEISMLLLANDIDFEIESIHGSSSGEQRRTASRMRSASVKVLVGTNVLESGVSLPWVDGGVSSGDTKIMHVNGNVRKLNKEELPSWRIHQQMGRVGRFKPGVFILAHPTAVEYRPEMSAPDIVRLPLTELVMHCTAFPDIRIHELKFTAHEQPKPGAVDQAIATLVNYGLIEEQEDGRVTLTEEGRLIEKLPVSYRAGVAFCEAHRMGKVAEMLPLIAMLDAGDLRHIMKYPMRGALWTTSEPVFQTMTVAQYFIGRNDLSRVEMWGLAEHHNVSLKKLNEYQLLLRDLEKKCGVRAKLSSFYHKDDDSDRQEFDQLTKQVIFRSMQAETYPMQSLIQSVRIPQTIHHGSVFTMARLSTTTNCSPSYPHQALMLSGNVRVITPKRGEPFAVLESATAFSAVDVKNLIKRFGRDEIERISNISNLSSALTVWLRQGHDRDDGEMRSDYVPGQVVDRFMTNLDRFIPVEEEVKPEVVVAEEEKTGSLGHLLRAAMTGRR